jgi:hypothetical protein
MPLIYPGQDQLPGLAYSVVKRPKFMNAPVQPHASGREVRIGYAQYPLWEFELTYEFLFDTPDKLEYKTLLGFFLAAQGSLNGFLLRDPDDNAVAGQAFTTTDGGTQTYGPLVRSIGAAGFAGIEPVGSVDLTKPFRLYRDTALVDPSDPIWGYSVATTTPVNQQITFTAAAPPAGHVLTLDMSFFYYVRFSDDSLDFEQFLHQIYTVNKVKLVSLRG